MSEPPLGLLGQLAIEHHMVTEEQVRRCLALQRDEPDKPLGKILLEQDYLTTGQLNHLIETQAETLRGQDELVREAPEEALFGRLAIHRGLIDEAQLAAAVREKANLSRLKINFRLGEILVKKGALTPAQVQQLLEAQQKKILICRACNCRFNIHQFSDDQTFHCRFCEARLDLPDDDDDSVAVRQSMHMRKMMLEDEATQGDA